MIININIIDNQFFGSQALDYCNQNRNFIMADLKILEPVVQGDTLELYQKLKNVITSVQEYGTSPVIFTYQGAQVQVFNDDGVLQLSFCPFVPFYCKLELVQESVELTVFNQKDKRVYQKVKFFYGTDIRLECSVDFLITYDLNVKFKGSYSLQEFKTKYTQLMNVITLILSFEY
jgi:hypothetical protein